MLLEKEQRCFQVFSEGEDSVKILKLGKKKSLLKSWEGPYLFVRYLDGKGSTGQDEGLTCIIKGGDNKY